MVNARFLLVISIFLIIALPIRQLMATEKAPSDIRILIDVSGSMKKNDPKNLRSPALEMVVGLLPEGSKAGVWTFAKYVNMLVPHRDVTKQWKKQAEDAASQIHSKGLFTNIEQVLNKATVSQKGSGSGQRQSVILLSDGLVDIATEKAPSLASRKRILDKTIPRLRQANISVHTIALADSSDHELLRDIALATDGWYEQVDSAEELQRVFLHLFEKAADRDSVPLTENNFKIDESVNEMTILAFRSAQSKPTELVLPDQSRLSMETMSEKVRWRHSDAGFDLITIADPQSGAWYIDAELDPDNRVMIITDLKLQTSDLPNNILIGETFDFTASLTEKDEVIKRQDFLKLIDVKLRQENELTDSFEQGINETQARGVYRTVIGDVFQPGRNDIVTRVNSGTFERERRQSINVVAMPFNIDVEQLFEQETRAHRITLKPDVSLIAKDSVSIAAMLTAEDGSEWSYDVLKSIDNTWQLTIAELQANEEYTVNLQIKAESLEGRPLFLQPEPLILIDEAPIVDTGSSTLETDEQGTIPDIEELIVDELGVDTDTLPEVSDQILSLPEEEIIGLDQDTDDEASREISATTLMYGNIVIILLLALGVFIWRKNVLKTQNPGEQL